MGEAFRDPEKLDIVGGRLGLEMKSCPFAKLWRIAAEIDGDVPDMARKGSNQLSLRLAELVVQASENAFSRKGLVVLYELTGQTGGEKCRLVEYLGEPTATISEALGLNESNVTKWGGQHLHLVSVLGPRADSTAFVFCLYFVPKWHSRG